MLWSIDTCQNKVSAGQYHVIIWQAQAKRLIDSGSLQANVSLTCWKQGRVVWMRVDTNPRLKNQRNNKFFLYTNVFHHFYFCVFWDYLNSKQKAKQYKKTLLQISKHSSKFSLTGTIEWMWWFNFNFPNESQKWLSCLQSSLSVLYCTCLGCCTWWRCTSE